jgi:hypothetical protein
MRPAFLIDVEDTARLLVAAVASSSITRERILAYYKRATWNDLRQQVRALRPEVVHGEDQALGGEYLADASTASRRAEGILQSIGQLGFTTEELMLKKFLDTCY